MFEQDSMTPPSSPLMQVQGQENERLTENMMKDFSQLQNEVDDVEDNNVPLCFTCVGECGTENNTTAAHGFLAKRHLERFLQNDFETFSKSFHDTAVPLFDDVDRQFYLVRKKLTKVELMLATVGNSTSGSEMLEDRVQIRHFFNYILWFLKSCASNWSLEKDHFIVLSNHLKGLLLYLGRLHEMSPSVLYGAPSKYGNKSSSLYHHAFHQHLEVHWAIIEILHFISVKFPQHLNYVTLCNPGVGETSVEGDLVSQVIQLLLWDIVQLALYKYKLKNSREVLTCSPFLCGCVKELLIMLRYLLDHRQQTLAKESMSMLLQPILQYIYKCQDGSLDTEGQMIVDDDCREINSDTYPVPPELDCTDPVGFCLWFIAGLIPTFQYDLNGNINPERLDRTQSQVFAFTLQQLAKKSIVMPEVQLRNHLRYNLIIASYLDSNTQILATYWDQFYKRLNDTYSLTSNTLGHLQSIKKTASGLLEKSQKIVVNDPLGLDTASSYVLFLHLLCIELQKSTDKRGASNPEWKSMKGRFYSKFHSRRMQELTELGLQHFSMLFLCLAQVADTQDVVQKMCDLYSTLIISAINTAKRAAIWRGCLAVMLYHVENNQDVSFLSEKMVASFNAVCSEISSVNADPSAYSESWPLIELYLDSTLEIIEISNSLDLHQHKLIGQGIKDILKVCKESDLRKLLSFAESVLTKHRILSRTSQSTNSSISQKLELSDTLWKYFYPFLKEHACTLTPPNQLSDLAAGFALMVIDLPPSVHSGVKEDLVGSFGYFAWNENVNSRVSCRFLCHLLPNQYAMDRLITSLPGMDIKLIQAWIKCCIEISPTDEEIQELTRLIQKVSTISEMLSSSVNCNLTPQILQRECGIFSFIHALGDRYSKFQDLKSKTDFRERVSQYFSEVPKLLNVLMKNCLSAEKMCNVFKIAGHMVRDCAAVLYLKSKPDCLLPTLIDKLALTRAIIVHNKPLPTHLLPALREYLHLFVQGLSRLDYKRDPYVQRKLKDIVAHYLNKFPVVSGSLTTSVHPLVISLSETFTRSITEEATNFRLYFLDLIKSEYLTMRVGPQNIPSNASNGWIYVLNVFSRTINSEQIAKDSVVLLRVALDYILLVENIELKGNASKVMQYLVESMAHSPHSVNLLVISSIIQKFFESHIHLYHGVRVIKTLDSVGVLFPDLLKPVIPVMTAAIKTSEGKRGVGLDKQLRMAYYNCLTNLGNEGNDEKTALLRATAE